MTEKHSARVGLTESQDFYCMEDLQQTQDFSSINPINLDYCGFEKCHSGYSFGPFVRSHYVLHMVEEGCGTLQKDGRTWEIGKDQAFLIRPGENATYQADKKDPWKYMWIGFHGLRAEEMMTQAGFSNEIAVIRIDNMDRISEAMKSMLSKQDLTPSAALARTADLYMILSLLIENREKAETVGRSGDESNDYQYVRRAVDIITRSYRNHIKVAEIAREIGISRNYLSSIFKRELGLTPQEFLIDYRMEVAAMLLRNTENPVNVIALEVGYGDPLSFSKTFRKKWEMSPSEYRQRKPELISRFVKGDYTSSYPL